MVEEIRDALMVAVAIGGAVVPPDLLEQLENENNQ
jgi:hypothetical protein